MDWPETVQQHQPEPGVAVQAVVVMMDWKKEVVMVVMMDWKKEGVVVVGWPSLVKPGGLPFRCGLNC